ncbi:Gfo/Idh/MocA family protein [Flavobacterium selenitireducens]|uniref:Gfo/Idh/MocA family protein n=1 Tax=Flavobacterium selenitireducens TaxID=2722704 RepID=UPI00168A7301|nr:Gfo/Idh/MocA family oxidoreductase [Flavobacterium selenitireducens]MBD3583489.1 Gfo/Idh/MocA family oxidoreductase [Flavobacterium selenitireducens]
MKKYKIGIIGYGGFGKFLHHWWSKLENVEIVAIADHGHHTKESADFKVYDNWKDLIEDPDVDIVSIVTPPALHAEMAIAAMKAGKHVLLEKPVAVTEATARQILEVQRQTGMVITVDHMIRYNPIIQLLKQLGKDGTLGKLRHAVVNNYAQDASLPIDHWFWDEALAGGILVEHGVHFFDIVNALSGQSFTEVCGQSDSRNDKQRDRVAAMVKYDDGLIAHYYHAFSGPGLFEQTTIALAYDLARVEIEGWIPLKGTVKALVNASVKDRLKQLPGWKIIRSESLASADDASRPEGWGGSEISGKDVRFGGVAYDVEEMISATFEIPKTKGEVYGQCVQSIMSDLIRKIENDDHKLAITIEDAVVALQTALLATGEFD